MEISPIFTVLGIINTVISVIACPIIAGYKNRSVVGWIFGGLFLGLTLDKCVILNTYMQYYFIALDYLDFYVIHYWDAAYKEKDEMYQNFNFNQNTINWTAKSSSHESNPR